MEMYRVVLQEKNLEVKLSRQEIRTKIYDFYGKNYQAKHHNKATYNVGINIGEIH